MTRRAVTVSLDDRGTAETIRVRLDPTYDAGELGVLVVQADAEAARERATPVVPAVDIPGERCPLSDLTERASALYERLGPPGSQVPDAQPPQAQRLAQPPEAPVRVTLLVGRIVGCVIDARWLARADQRALDAEFGRALSVARTSAAALSGDVARLMADVKTTLREMARG